MSKRKNREVNPMILILVVLVLVCIAVWCMYYFTMGQNASGKMRGLRQTYIVEENGSDIGSDITNLDDESDKYTEESAMGGTSGEKDVAEGNTYVTIDGVEYPDFTGLDVPRRKVDFQGLQEYVNPHIYAWIYIPGTKIDYPVLQHPQDDEYYLNHDMAGNKVSSGSIFTQHYNGLDFTDNHTVLYGHNMKNGTMFKALHKYMDDKFFAENPYIYIYTEEETKVYEIYGAYEYSDKHLLLSYDMEEDKSFEQYLEEIKAISDSMGHFNRTVELTSADKIITLSTCIGGRPESRYLVQAKLIAVESEGDED